MVIYVGLMVVCCGLALLIRENCIKNSNQEALNRTIVLFIFLAMFAVSACRVAVGNDYWVYKLNFTEIAGGREGVLAYEPGFLFLVKALQFLFGKESYIAVFAFFSFFTVLFFVRAVKDQSEWIAFSLFLLLANGYYYSSLNTVRYYLVFAMALWSMKFVIERRHAEFILTIVLAAFMHKTVLIVIPVYYICRIRWKPWFFALLGAGSASLIFFKDFYRMIIFKVYPYYQGSEFDTGRVSYMNILKAGAVLIFCVIFYKQAVKDDIRNTFYFNLSVISFIVYTCCSFVPEYTRLGYYFAGAQIFLLPSVVRRIENKKVKILMGSGIVFCFAVYFIFFLKSCYQVSIRLLPYYSWIFMP
ncbi:MAG: EpsG family protein [Lachnospiraceae bacterium]|nr:EpsG family protein [Lachnospiraceae bacterium]